MLELFSRVPDVLRGERTGRLTAIPVDDEISSFSAILLDDAYYDLIQRGRTDVRGVPVVRSEYLVVLKAKAWLDLRAREGTGQERVDAKDIRKHRNDVIRLYQVLDPELRLRLAPAIEADMRRFVMEVSTEQVDFKALGLAPATTMESVLALLGLVYGLNPTVR